MLRGPRTSSPRVADLASIRRLGVDHPWLKATGRRVAGTHRLPDDVKKSANGLRAVVDHLVPLAGPVVLPPEGLLRGDRYWTTISKGRSKVVSVLNRGPQRCGPLFNVGTLNLLVCLTPIERIWSSKVA